MRIFFNVALLLVVIAQVACSKSANNVSSVDTTSYLIKSVVTIDSGISGNWYITTKSVYTYNSSKQLINSTSYISYKNSFKDSIAGSLDTMKINLIYSSTDKTMPSSYGFRYNNTSMPSADSSYHVLIYDSGYLTQDSTVFATFTSNQNAVTTYENGNSYISASSNRGSKEGWMAILNNGLISDEFYLNGTTIVSTTSYQYSSNSPINPYRRIPGMFFIVKSGYLSNYLPVSETTSSGGTTSTTNYMYQTDNKGRLIKSVSQSSRQAVQTTFSY